MLTIATVLKSGGDFEPKHVKAVQGMCEKYMPEHRFICLTDMEVPGCETIPLEFPWRGWWARMELYQVKGPLLYTDLDVIIVRDATQVVNAATGKPFVILRDFYGGGKRMGGGLMYWEMDMSPVFEAYKANPVSHGRSDFWLETIVPAENVTYWQDITQGVVSYKVHVRDRGLLQSDKIVCFHGSPRPWQQKKIKYEV